MAHQRTKEVRKQYWFLQFLSIILSIGPLCIYTVMAYNSAAVVEKKFAFSMMAVVCVIIAGVSLFKAIAAKARYHVPQSILWIMVLGFYLCVDKFLGCIMVVALCSIVNELLIHPLATKAKNDLIHNKHQDKREGI